MKQRNDSGMHYFSITDLMHVRKPLYIQRPYELSVPKIHDLLLDITRLPEITNIPLILEIGFPDKNGFLDYYHEDSQARKNFNINNISKGDNNGYGSEDTVEARMYKGQSYILDGQQRLGALKFYFNSAIDSMLYNESKNKPLLHDEKEIIKLSHKIPLLSKSTKQALNKGIHFNHDDFKQLVKPWIPCTQWIQKVFFAVSHQTNSLNKSNRIINKLKRLVSDAKHQIFSYHYSWKGIQIDLQNTIACIILKTPRKDWNKIFNAINGKGTMLNGYQMLDSNWEGYLLEIPHILDHQTHQDIGDQLIKYAKEYLEHKESNGPAKAHIKISGTLPTSKNRTLNLAVLSRSLGKLAYNHLSVLIDKKPTYTLYAELGVGVLRIVSRTTTATIKKIQGKPLFNKISKYDSKNKRYYVNTKIIKRLIEIFDNLNGYFAYYLNKSGSNMQKTTSHKTTYATKPIKEKEILSFLADLWNDGSHYDQSLPGIMLEYLLNDNRWVGDADHTLNMYITGTDTYRLQSPNKNNWLPQLQKALQSNYESMDKQIENGSANIHNVLDSNRFLNTIIVVMANATKLYDYNGNGSQGYDNEHLLSVNTALQYEHHYNDIHLNHLGNLTQLGHKFNISKQRLTIYQSQHPTTQQLKVNGIKHIDQGGVDYPELFKRTHYFVKIDNMDYGKSKLSQRHQDLDIQDALKKHNFKFVNKVIGAREKQDEVDLINHFCKQIKQNNKGLSQKIIKANQIARIQKDQHNDSDKQTKLF